LASNFRAAREISLPQIIFLILSTFGTNIGRRETDRDMVNGDMAQCRVTASAVATIAI